MSAKERIHPLGVAAKALKSIFAHARICSYDTHRSLRSRSVQRPAEVASRHGRWTDGPELSTEPDSLVSSEAASSDRSIGRLRASAEPVKNCPVCISEMIMVDFAPQ